MLFGFKVISRCFIWTIPVNCNAFFLTDSKMNSKPWACWTFLLTATHTGTMASGKD